MIDFGRILLVGRHERIPEERRVVLAQLAPSLKRASEAMSSRWPDRLDAWTRWNVVAWHVLGGPLQRVDLLRFEGLGERPLPHLVERWCYIVNLHHIDPLPVPSDAPLLHRSSEVLDPEEPMKLDTGRPVVLKREWRNHVEQISLLERALEREGLLDAPQAQTVKSMESLLHWKGLRIERHHNGWRLVQVEPSEGLGGYTSASGCLDDQVPKRLDVQGPKGVQFHEQAEARASK